MEPLYPTVVDSVAVGAASAASVAFPEGTQTVRLAATTDCYIAFGAAPTAATTGIILFAGAAEYFHARPGDKVAVLQVSAAGTLSVTAMAR